MKSVQANKRKCKWCIQNYQSLDRQQLIDDLKAENSEMLPSGWDQLFYNTKAFKKFHAMHQHTIMVRKMFVPNTVLSPVFVSANTNRQLPFPHQADPHTCLNFLYGEQIVADDKMNISQWRFKVLVFLQIVDVLCCQKILEYVDVALASLVF